MLSISYMNEQSVTPSNTVSDSPSDACPPYVQNPAMKFVLHLQICNHANFHTD